MNNSWWVDEAQLDDDQKDVIELEPYGSCLIQGPPGSGKTNLLALRAKYLQKLKRHNFAFIAFTKGFKAFLDFGLNQYGIGDDALFTYFSWAHRMCKNHGVPLSYEDQGAFDENRQHVYEAIASIVYDDAYKPDYDTILLDEAQDYTAKEIEIIKASAENLMLVADSRQRIFSDSEKDFKLIAGMVDNVITLKYHYRNGHKICKVADYLDKSGNKIIGSSNYKEEENPSRVEYKQYPSTNDSIDHLIDTISNQLVAYSGENVGIICPTRVVLDSLQALKSSKIGKYCSFHFDEGGVNFSSGKTVYCLTLHSAKGMEFRAVHMFGWDILNMPLPRNVIYTAVTRAKTSLSVYYLNQLNRPFMQALAALDPKPAAPKLSELFN